MRVLLTGATGFVGSHLLDRLVASGRHEVAVLMRPSSDPRRIAGALGRVAAIRGDLADPMASRGAVVAFAPDAVLHLGWSGVAGRSRDDAAQVDNVRGTVALVELAREAGARTFVGLGSQAEYGPREGRTAEDAPERPDMLYGVAKVSARMFAARLCETYGIRFAWLRLFSCYGPRDEPSCLIPSLIRALLRGDRPSLTAGDQIWDYLHVDDAAQAVERVAEVPSAEGTFNLGSGRPRRLREVVERVRDLIDPGLPLGFGEVPYRPGQVMHLEADIARLRERVGWSPEVELDEGLRRTIAWHREYGGGAAAA